MTGRVDFSALSEFRKKVEKHLEETSAQTDELKQTGQIPPTIRINQGSRIGIFTARNIDMSSVYELKQKQ